LHSQKWGTKVDNNFLRTIKCLWLVDPMLAYFQMIMAWTWTGALHYFRVMTEKAWLPREKCELHDGIHFQKYQEIVQSSFSWQRLRLVHAGKWTHAVLKYVWIKYKVRQVKAIEQYVAVVVCITVFKLAQMLRPWIKSSSMITWATAADTLSCDALFPYF